MWRLQVDYHRGISFSLMWLANLGQIPAEKRHSHLPDDAVAAEAIKIVGAQMVSYYQTTNSMATVTRKKYPLVNGCMSL
jgi:hypothetical protein